MKVKLLLRLIKNKDPYLLKRVIHNIKLILYRVIFKLKKRKDGVNIRKKEWDYLIILDACRYNFLKKSYKKHINGEIKKVNSLGSSTVEWMVNTFENTSNENTIYITANPHMTKKGIFTSSSIHLKSKKGLLNFKNCSFFKVFELWKNNWNEGLGTVHPKEILERTLEIKKKFPKKRLIIHFLQPHDPYIGKTKLYDKIDIKNKNRTVGNLIQDEVRYGKITEKELISAYNDNLRLALSYVKKLISHLNGKIIVTADHGEAFGEKGIYFHPTGIYIKELIEVPWLIINKSKKTKEKIKELKI